MKKSIAIFSAFILMALWMALSISSCKKESGYSITQTTDDSQTQAIIADDELFVNNEFEQVVNDAVSATAISSTTSGDVPPTQTGNALFTTVTGAVIDTSRIDSGLITITYFGTNADHTIGRSGVVKIKHALNGSGNVIPWKTIGAIAEITFDQYEIVVLATNKSLWFNGSGTVSNVTGELMPNIANSAIVPGDTLVDKIRAQINFTFNDNVSTIKTWNWNLSLHRVFNGVNPVITCSVSGDTAIDDMNNVALWGTNRFDENFYTCTSAPVMTNISGSSFLNKPLSGLKVIKAIPEQLTITFGVDSQGDLQTSGNPYGYKITWFRAGSQQSVISY
jgi:hypothetical protein